MSTVLNSHTAKCQELEFLQIPPRVIETGVGSCLFGLGNPVLTIVKSLTSARFLSPARKKRCRSALVIDASELTRRTTDSYRTRLPGSRKAGQEAIRLCRSPALT